MSICLPNLRTPALLGALITLPFALLEIIHQKANPGFPISLFVMLWLSATLFFATLLPILRYLRAGGKLLDHPFSLFTRLVVLFMLGSMWLGIISDQMPCFLGIPNCD
jgi:hypothetical protein